MEPSILFVEPALPIHEAITLAQGKHQDVVGYRLGEAHQKDSPTAEIAVAHRDDLEKMVAMGLENVPVEGIAVSQQVALLPEARIQLTATNDYSRRLSEYFPVYFVAALYELQSLMQRLSMKGYVIGGIPRDLLQFQEKRLSVKDVDITVEGDALTVARFLMENSRNFELVEEFPEFGTAKVRYKETLMFDFASTRQEIYPHCGALPVVVKRGVSLIEDVGRRDFTINALAFAVHNLGHVLDHSHGVRDIQQRRIRVLHPVSFFEDPSRILRALKFCARFDFDLADETRHLLFQFLKWGEPYYKGGGERIKQELRGLLKAEESPAKTRWLAFFMEARCYPLISMETTYHASPETIERFLGVARFIPLIESMLSHYLERDFTFPLYLCFLFRDWPAEEFPKVCLRLGLTKSEREAVEQFRRLKSSVQERFGRLHEFSAPAEIYDLFYGLPQTTVLACLVELGFTHEKSLRTILEAFVMYKRKWEKLQLELDGNDLIGLGVPEGKVIGQLLTHLRHAKLAGQVPERLDEIRYVRERLAEQQPEENNAARLTDAGADAAPAAPNGSELDGASFHPIGTPPPREEGGNDVLLDAP